MRARTRSLLLFAAVALIATIAGLLLREEGGPSAGEDGKRRMPPVGVGAGRSRPAPPRNSPAGPDAAAEAPATEGPRLDLRAVVGGEWGLAGVQVLAVERFRDGSLVAMIGDDAPDGGETDAEGRITLRYKAEPAERLFGILPDAAEFESAENAEPVGEIGPFRVFRARDLGPVTLRFRDPEGVVLLRPLDARTGEVLAGRSGIRLAWMEHGQGEETEEGGEHLVEKSPGWLRAWAVDEAVIQDLRLVVPGYFPAPAPAGGWKGRAVLALDPDPTVVRGRLLLPEGWAVSATLRSPADGREKLDVGLVGMPERAGAFAIGGVPPGEWDLVVMAWRGRQAEEISWEVRRFEFRGAGLDLGDLRPMPGAVLRARLLGRDGRPVTEGKLHLCRAFPGEVPLLSYSRWKGGLSVHAAWDGRDQDAWSSTQEPGEEGWVEFRGLRPAGTYLLATPSVPGLIRMVEAPAKPGEVLSVELDGNIPLTTCVLRFTMEGEEAAFWQGMAGPAYNDQFSTGKGVLEADIPPGRYRIGASGSPGPEPVFRHYEADLVVPDSGRFEVTVDLKPPTR